MGRRVGRRLGRLGWRRRRSLVRRCRARARSTRARSAARRLRHVLGTPRLPRRVLPQHRWLVSGAYNRPRTVTGGWTGRAGVRSRLRQVLHAVGDVTLDKPLQFGILQLVLGAEVRREVPRVVTREDMNGALAPVRDLDGHLEDNPSPWPARGVGAPCMRRKMARGRVGRRTFRRCSLAATWPDLICTGAGYSALRRGSSDSRRTLA